MAKAKPYTKQVKQLMAEKSRLLSKAEAFEQMNLGETAQPLWATVAASEERLAPLLDLLGRESEAALHRISAASAYERCGQPGRAANLYRAALAGPLDDAARKDVGKKLTACLKQLQRDATQSVA
ncbi:MAG TPA: hypothetical protein VLI90_04775 [Tepidisphaeraceae bacterium]|nr:hypothetical protein [Tepidisphaeraceae bacterium]